MGLSDGIDGVELEGEFGEPEHDMSPHEAADRWIDIQRKDHSESSVATLYYRLKQFTLFCERNDIYRLRDLSVWDMDEYTLERSSEINKVSLNNQLGTIENWLEWCAARGLVDEDVVSAIELPDIPKQQQSNDVKLAGENAVPHLIHLRSSPECGSRDHAMFEVMWHIGCRLGGVRALDLDDYIRNPGRDEYILYFRHRPDSDTPLKNQMDGERPVGLTANVAGVIDTYIDEERVERRDEYGRQPLFTTSQGRVAKNTVRLASYFMTAPCRRISCPYDREEEACEWWDGDSISKCPSTRSPHQVRTGSISWQLDRGVPLQVVAKRANASPEIIRKHYDKTDPVEEMRKRRRPHLGKLDVETSQYRGGSNGD